MTKKPQEQQGPKAGGADAPTGEAFVYRALKALQASNLEALTHGEGRGHSTLQMARILDRELGFSQLYDALALYVEHFGDPLWVGRAALAKASGVPPK